MTAKPSARGVPRRGRLRLVLLAAVSAFALVVVPATSADAYWSTSGAGAGAATVDTLAAPATVAVSSYGPTVTVTWAGVSPPVGTLTGYYVTRYAGASPANACGTDPANPATFVPAGTTTCADASVPDGTYTYTVTAVLQTWTAVSPSSNAVAVVGDISKPSQSVTLAAGATNAYLSGVTLYYRGSVAGSFQLIDSVTDAGSGPASATYPDIATTGWTHPAETVTTGSGSAPTIAYTSSAFTWTANPSSPGGYTLTGRDVLGNAGTLPITVASDTTGPTSGALTVNGVAASAAGSASAAKTTFAISVRTDYNADAASGVAGSVLTRQSATLTAGSCGVFGSAVTVVGSPSQSGLTTGCYRYTLTGTDNVGNTSSVSTTVTYDTVAPTQIVAVGSGVNASQTGTVIYFRSNTAGSYVLADAVTDADGGPASATFPVVATAGWTHPAETVSTGTGSLPTVTYTSSTFSWTAGASKPGTLSVVGRDVAGNTVTTALTFSADITVPISGKLTVNAIAASAAGSSSFNKTGAFTISTRTDYTDAGSGLASSTLTVQSATLTGNVCGTYGTPTVLIGTPAQAGLATACYKYTLTGTDKVGNTVAISTTVKVDSIAPVSGALTVNALAANTAGTTSFSNAASFPIDARTDWTDANSGITTSTLGVASATLAANACGAFGAATTIVGTPVQSGLTTHCYKYTLTGTDTAGNTSVIITTVKYDTAAPTGGALTVNAVAASAGGSTSTVNAPSFTIGTRTDWIDAASGLATSTLTRQFATQTGASCASFGAATVIVGNPAQAGLASGCYLYTLTGTDNAGNIASISTTVHLGPYVTAVTLTNGTGTAGRVDQSDQIQITYSDPMSVSSLCSTWSGDGSDQTINADNQVTVTLTNGGAGNDTLTISSPTCTLNLGTINLGSTAYTTATVTYGGAGANKSTLAWSASTQKLTITLGQVSGAGPATVATSAATLTPSTSALNTSNTPIGGTFTTTNVKQF